MLLQFTIFDILGLLAAAMLMGAVIMLVLTVVLIEKGTVKEKDLKDIFYKD